MELINNQIKQRASKTLRCMPFNTSFYADAKQKGLRAEKVFEKSNLYKVDSERWFKNPNEVEAAFRWLITTGILRREVDGQGLTSKIRLTPFGRQLIERTPDLPTRKASIFEKAHEWLYRNFHFQ